MPFKSMLRAEELECNPYAKFWIIEKKIIEKYLIHSAILTFNLKYFCCEEKTCRVFEFKYSEHLLHEALLLPDFIHF